MARTVKVELVADVARYMVGVNSAKRSTKDLAGELSDAARRGEVSAKAIDRLGDQAAESAVEMRRLGAAAEDASDEVRQLDRAMDRVGGRFDGSIRSVRALDQEIDRTRGEVLRLAQAINDSPTDLPLLKSLKKERATLRELEQVKKLLPGEDDGKKSADSVSRGFSGRLIHGLAGAGLKAGEALGAALPGGIGRGLQTAGPMASTVITAALVVLVASTASVVGAAVSGAILAGLSGGTIGAGLLLAARDSRVKAAGAELGKTVLQGLEDAADIFVGPLEESIHILGRGFADVLPDIRRGFASVAPYVDDLARGLVSLGKNALPGVNRALERSGPILLMLSEEAGELGDAFSDALSDIAGEADGATLGLKAMFDLVEAGVRITGSTLAGLADSFMKAVKAAGLVADALLGAGAGAIPFYGSAIKRVSENSHEAQIALEEFKSAAQGVQEGSQTGWGMDVAGRFFAFAADEARALSDDIVTLNDTLQRNADANLNAAQAALDYRDGLKEARDAIDKKKKVNAGEEEALIRLARRSNELTGAWVKQGQSAGEVAAKGATLRADFIATAQRMGYTRKQAEALADQYLAIPRNVNTKITADTAAASRRIAGFAKQVRDLRGKTITIHTQFTSSGEHIVGGIGAGTQVARRWGGITEHAASGLLREPAMFTPRAPARYAYAEPATGGEAFIPKYTPYRGQALDILGQAAGWHGAAVVSKAALMPAPAAYAAARPTLIEITFPGHDGVSELFRQIRKEVRTVGGGNVQLAFGRAS